ncbi:hypothetical protein CB1_000544026 [Camelus ferus]|nr:hypothetical protein CB1_000544026 [Camelus ferus]
MDEQPCGQKERPQTQTHVPLEQVLHLRVLTGSLSRAQGCRGAAGEMLDLKKYSVLSALTILPSREEQRRWKNISFFICSRRKSLIPRKGLQEGKAGIWPGAAVGFGIDCIPPWKKGRDLKWSPRPAVGTATTAKVLHVVGDKAQVRGDDTAQGSHAQA